MNEWPLVGRSRELAQLRDLVADPACRGVLIAAGAGTGKTRLAREALREAEHAGMSTLVATASPAVAAVPLGAMASTLSAFGGLEGSAHEDPAIFLQHAAHHLASRAGERGVFLLVDDAHLLDNTSAALVHQLAQRDEVFVVATLRSREPAPDAITALWKDGLVERVELHALDAPAVEQLLRVVLGNPVDGGTAALLSSRSQGNLLFLREMVFAARADGSLRLDHDLWRLVGESAPSNALVELVETNLGRLAGPQRHLLELLAVGEPLGTRELETLSSIETAEQLEDSGLITSRSDGQRLEVRLAHPVYGEVLRSRLSGLASRRVARALAEALEQTGLRRRDDGLRVAVWRLSIGGGTPEQLLAAARTARWHLDLSLAFRLAKAAAESGAGFEAELLTAQLLLRLGRADEADAAFARLCSEPDETDRVRATLARVDIAQARYRPEEMHKLLAGVDPLPEDPGLRAAIAARDGIASLMLRGPRACLETTVPEFDPGQGDAAIALHSTRAVCFSRMGKHDQAEQELARMDAHRSDSSRLGWWRIPCNAAVNQHLVNTGRLPDAVKLAEGDYTRATDLGSVELQMLGAYTLGRRLLETGRIDSAAKLSREALALAEQLTYELVASGALCVLAMSEALSLRIPAARAALHTAEAIASDYAYSRALVQEAAAWIAVAEGDLDSARLQLVDTAAFCLEVGDFTGAIGSWHCLVRIGHPKDALDGLSALSAEMDGPWAPLFVQHARGVVDGDGATLEATAREFDVLGARLLAADAAADAARAWQRAGEARHATAARNQAIAFAECCEGAQTPSLRGLHERQPLTEAERETAVLAAAGGSNRAIAAQLQLSVRTVESRLQNAYQKLGVTSREDLGAALLRDA
jgi:DNA-binding CsgD family transcriptional regulator